MQTRRPNPYQFVEDLKEYLLSESSEKAKVQQAYTVFREVFGADFRIESDAQGADGYVEGKLVLELKSDYREWLSGLFQGLYYKKKGLSFPYVVVMSHRFLALWRVTPDDRDNVPGLPPFVAEMLERIPANRAPSDAGPELAGQLSAAQKQQLLESAIFRIDESDFKLNRREAAARMRDASLEGLSSLRLFEFKNRLTNLEAARIQVNSQNFIQTIAYMRRFFRTPLDAIHAFYDLVHFWDITCFVSYPGQYSPNPEGLRVFGRGGRYSSEKIFVPLEHQAAFIDFVESRYLFTNEGSGISLDYYFSRFDEALAEVDPDFVKQHGIFFTSDALAKFSLWFVEEYFEKELGEKYVVIDPAGGSGNLVTSWAMPLKHKIVSELQPDLLRIIERRLQFDPAQREMGFTVVPKTSEGRGLNFLDKPATEYLDILERSVAEKNLTLDKPLAFLLNPPYKNTDEADEARAQVDAGYEMDPDILALTGPDAVKERYLAFVAQVQRMIREQLRRHPGIEPLMMIFTPTSWLLPRPTYTAFREMYDQEFEFLNGFMVTAGEFFRLPGAGRWPVTFTLWRYRPQTGRRNRIWLYDFSDWTFEDLHEVNWDERERLFRGVLRETLLSKQNRYEMHMRGDIRQTIPQMEDPSTGKKYRQTRYNSYRNRNKSEANQRFVAGFAAKDDRHTRLAVPYGYANGDFVSLMDNNALVRIRQDKHQRMSRQPDRVWFRLDHDLKSANRIRMVSAPPDKYGFCAQDLPSAKALFAWYTIAKVLNGKFPVWMNQMDLWPAQVPEAQQAAWYAMCFAYGLATNNCIVARFPAHDPLPGNTEIWLDNPMAPTHQDNLWRNVLAPHAQAHPAAAATVEAATALYRLWDAEVTLGRPQLSDALSEFLIDEIRYLR